MSKLISELKKSFFEKPIADLTVDYLDIGLDMITDSIILDNIPVVKSFVAFFKAGMSLKERHFAKKLANFVKQIHEGNIPESEFQKRKNAINNHEKWVEKEIEEIVIFLDRFDFSYKALMLAKLYVALINGVISSDKYLNMLPIIDKWQKYDSNTLKTIYNEHKKTTLNMEYGNRDYVISIDLASKQRLESLGVIGITREVKDLLKEFGEIDEKDIEEIKEEGQYCLDERYKLTYEGVILAEILFEDKVLTKFNKDYFNVSYI